MKNSGPNALFMYMCKFTYLDSMDVQELEHKPFYHLFLL